MTMFFELVNQLGDLVTVRMIVSEPRNRLSILETASAMIFELVNQLGDLGNSLGVRVISISSLRVLYC